VKHTRSLLLLNAHALDLATLLPLVTAYGAVGEANPVVRLVYGLAGTAGIVALKATGTALLLLTRRWRVLSTLAIVVGMLGALTNAVAWSLLS
jgi:hypothetical protein